jgi:hypothetical protein
VGTGTHLGIEKFNLAAGINATHVPARGTDAIADTIANTIAGRHSSPSHSDARRGHRARSVRSRRARVARETRWRADEHDAARLHAVVLRESESAARIIEAAGIKPQQLATSNVT